MQRLDKIRQLSKFDNPFDKLNWMIFLKLLTHLNWMNQIDSPWKKKSPGKVAPSSVGP
jgi:hypothetical protein